MADGQPEGPRGQIFRPEALAHRARQRGPGDVVRVAPRWTTGAFYLLIGFFVAGLVASVVVEVDRYAKGTTATDGAGKVVVLLPAAVAPEVAVGRPVELGGTQARVAEFDAEVLSPSEVAQRYDVEVIAPSVAVVTSAEGSGRDGGVARVLVEREPAIVALVPGLKAIFGESR